MKLLLLQKWCQAPWHAWLKEEPLWLNLFAELWSKLPENAVRQILLSSRTFIALPPVNQSYTFRITQPLPLGAHFLLLDFSLIKRPITQSIAILAHEMAHLCIPPTADPAQNDLLADKLVLKWGLKKELLEALSQDLDNGHPRVTNLTA